MHRTGSILIVLGLLIVQVASAQTARPQSDSYWMPSDVQPVGGGEAAKSTKYILDDTIGEANVGPTRSDTFDLNAGYRQTVAPAYIAMNCDEVANMGTITLSGVAEGSATCTVTTDADAGYALSWRAGTNNSNGLVGHWKFDETTGTVAYDSSGLGNHGDHNGTTISTLVANEYISTRSLDFDGSADYVSVDTDPLGANYTHYSFAMFVRPTADQAMTFVARSNMTSGQSIISAGYDVVANNELFFDDFLPSGGYTEGGSLTLNEWAHVAFVRDGSTRRIYKNGVLVAEQTGVESYTGSAPTNLFIGVDRRSSGNSRYMEGQLDDVRIYNRALSAAEIRDLASKAPPGSLVMSGSQTTHIAPLNMPFTGGLIGHWKMDEPVAGTVADSSGYGNDGTPAGAGGANNTPAVSTDVPSGANHITTRSLDFDGTDDYVRITPVQAKLSDFSFSLWAKPDASANGYIIHQYGNSGNDNANAMIFQESSGIPRMSIYDGASDSLLATTEIDDGIWHHIVVTREGSVATIYVDGNQENADPDFKTDLIGFQNDLYFGINTVGGSAFFEGQIDDVRIYNRALSAAEIQALAGVPQSWSVANNDARWGARLSSASDDTDAKWGTDGSSEAWLNVGEGSYPLVTRTTRTDEGGSDEIIQFRAEIGATAIRPNGTYTSSVVMTASAL